MTTTPISSIITPAITEAIREKILRLANEAAKDLLANITELVQDNFQEIYPLLDHEKLMNDEGDSDEILADLCDSAENAVTRILGKELREDLNI